MLETREKSIQMTLFDHFNSYKQFTLPEANKYIKEERNMPVNTESIRARIYEGIDKGIFTRLSRGVYSIKHKIDGKESEALLIQGDGRDLSFIQDGTIDLIVTDHPYSDKEAHKGGNRSFADYDCFRYVQEDFNEKCRVLKDGAFLVEFLPEESSTNFEYLYDIKVMAQKAGLNYYSKVPWKKGKFVANTGRKSKNSEDVMIFTKGKARAMRPNVKKDLAEPTVKHYMSGSSKMLPTVFDFEPPSKKSRVHQAEKPVNLLVEILQALSMNEEVVLDQFAGSGNLGIAALKTGRNAILIEKDEEIYSKMQENIEKKIS